MPLSIETLQPILLRPVRKVLGPFKRYFQRIFRWGVILVQIRGDSFGDEVKLWSSAFISPLISLHNINAWQDPVLLFDASVVVRGIGKFKCRRHCDDLWHVLPWREKAIFKELSARLRPGDVFIDAGANIGIYTVLASKLVGPSGKVICVEMMPDTAQRLEAHLCMNGLENVTLVREAISDKAGAEVTAIVQEGKYGQASIANQDAAGSNTRQIKVMTTTLDAICDDVSRVRVMKMDLEGVELPALIGSKNMLPRLESLIYESWGRSRTVINPVDDLLIDAGFNLSQLDGNNWLASKVVN